MFRRKIKDERQKRLDRDKKIESVLRTKVKTGFARKVARAKAFMLRRLSEVFLISAIAFCIWFWIHIP